LTITSDLGAQTEGIGAMHGVVIGIDPDIRIVDLAHGLPSFKLSSAARTLEAVRHLPVGYHVCVVAPGVGTERRGIILKVRRGDYLIGPDNGVLLPAAHVLGGIEKAVLIKNEKFMNQPVSPVFHGRDVYAPVAAHLARGINIDEFGEKTEISQLHEAPYKDAVLDNEVWQAHVIHVNSYGNCQLNISREQWQGFLSAVGEAVGVQFKGKEVIRVEYQNAFGDVKEDQPLIYIDELERISLALNLGNFAEEHEVAIGHSCIVWKG